MKKHATKKCAVWARRELVSRVTHLDDGVKVN